MATFKLIYGDKESPTDSLDLNDGSDFRLRSDSGALGPGESTLLFDVMGESQADLRWLVQTLERWGRLARRRPLRLAAEGQQVWIEYSWLDVDPGRPVFGQWYRYLQVSDISLAAPAGIHSGNLPGANPLIEGLAVSFKTALEVEGVERLALYADSTDDTAEASVTMSDEFNDSFTLAGWVQVDGTANAGLVSYGSGGAEFEISQTNDNNLEFSWDGNVIYATDGSTYAFGDSTVYKSDGVTDGWHHVALAFDNQAVSGSDSVSIYIDGDLACLCNDYAGIGYFLGVPAANAVLTFNDDNERDLSDFTGWLVWSSLLSAAILDDVYNQTSLIDDPTVCDALPVVYASAGDGALCNVDGTVSSVAKDNWAIAWGIPGGLPALARFEVVMPASVSDAGVWLGRLSAESILTSTSSWWVDLSGTADVGNSSGDAYEGDTTSGSGSDTSVLDGSLAAPQRGRYLLLARLKVDNADSQALARIAYNGVVYAETNEITTTDSASFILQNLGDVFIDWPESSAPASATVAVVVTEQEATALAVGCDFICLLPWPYVYAYTEAAVSTSSGDVLHLREPLSWLESSAGAWQSIWLARGGPVTLVPGEYNHLVWLLGAESAAYTVGTNVTLRVYVTPRWALPQ
jgi:hypothetical protein